jgi:hypothetical protein
MDYMQDLCEVEAEGIKSETEQDVQLNTKNSDSEQNTVILKRE